MEAIGARRRAVENRLTRTRGASPEATHALREQAAQWTDWVGTCQVCGTPRRGSLEALKGPCPSCEDAKEKADEARN